MEKEKIQFVVITGMSGAGRTVAIQSFEDMGYFCIDNMPPSLVPKFWELLTDSGKIQKVALVIDVRSRSFFEAVQEMLVEIENTENIDLTVLFLDASDEELVSRYKETRRTHPSAREGRVIDGIHKERELLAEIKGDSQIIIDTTELSPRELREKINRIFRNGDSPEFRIEFISFGFKYGLPIDADVVMDVRFLPNPHYVPELKPLTGLDQPVYDYVMGFEETEEFFRRFMSLLELIIPGYKKEGKSNVNIAIGCTGGQHRSVALTERTAHAVEALGYKVHISHRDQKKRKETVNRS